MKKFGLFALLTLGLLLNGCAKSPKAVLNLSKDKMLEIKTYHYQISTDTNLNVKDQSWKFRCALEGDMDTSQEEPNANNHAEFAVTNDSNLNFELIFNIINLKEMLYFQLNRLDLPAQLLPSAGADKGSKQFLGIYNLITGLKGQWIKFDLSEYYRMKELDSKALLEKQKKFNQEIKKLAGRTQFVSSVENLGDANLQNTDCYHYRVIIDKNQILEFAVNYRNLAVQIFGAKNFPVNDQQKFETAIKDFLAKCGDLTLETWIGKSDYYLYGLKTSLEIVPSPTMDKVVVPINAEFSRYNEPVSISAPGGAKTLLELLPKSPLSLPNILPGCPTIPAPGAPKTAPAKKKTTGSPKAPVPATKDKSQAKPI